MNFEEMRLQENTNRGFKVLFFIFYGLILIAWLFVLGFHFARLFQDNSFVLSQFLVSGKSLTNPQITNHPWYLILIDIILKFNVLVLGTVFGTTFLIYNILPKMKKMPAWVMISAFIATYIPTALTIQSYLSGAGKQWWLHHMTINEFLLLVLLYPLNYAVFFYLYYMIEKFILEPKRAQNLA